MTMRKTDAELAISQQVQERNETYSCIPVARFPKLGELSESTTLGAFSWTGLSTKTRLMQQANLIHIEGCYASPADVARDYLRWKFTEKRRATTSQYQAIMQHRAFPLYAEPQYLPDAAYVDLRAAYWSIVQIVGWNVEYNPNKWLGKGKDMSDFPYAGNKIARNCLVTAGLLVPSRLWNIKSGKLVMVKKGNPLANYGLWACVMDVLNAIAAEMRELGAVYVHTDGYIMPQSQVDKAIQKVAEWGIEARVKSKGDAWIYAAGAYAIGQKATRKAIDRHVPHSSISEKANRQWLKTRIAKFAQLTRMVME